MKKTATSQEVKASGCYYFRYTKLRTKLIKAGVITTEELLPEGKMIESENEFERHNSYLLLERAVDSEDEKLRYLQTHDSVPDDEAPLLQLWIESYNTRTQSFIENKALKRPIFYLSFRCLDSQDGWLMVRIQV